MARNSFFQFKQFRVNQDKCAMKVCTDACVLGAWADIESAERVLDIGTGTGLLAMMVAQRNANAKIDAIELDFDASSQALENIKNSPFASRIEVINESVQKFVATGLYDCIITNPPFFQSDLLSSDDATNMAHHSVTLSFDELLNAFDTLLTKNGTVNVLLPVDQATSFTKMATFSGWKLIRQANLFHSIIKKPFRQLLVYQRNDFAENQTIACNIYIYEEDGSTYTDQFGELLKDFYLIF